jgi:hypothetical protein
MRTFRCNVCEQILFFENSLCTRCGSSLAFLPDVRVLAAVVESGDGEVCLGEGSTRYRHCKNRLEHGNCNWAVSLDDGAELCECCRLNEIIPDLQAERALELWARLEVAKRRLLYTVHDLGLSVAEDPTRKLAPLRFRFMADQPEAQERVHTGHQDGVITINIAEADHAHREKVREEMGEGYRTLLGHFRHESGHLFWDRLIASDDTRLQRFRQLFGDERADYGKALAAHYEKGPGPCPEEFVSSYATMHPWEDWAETWAHYLHLVDTLETAGEYGMKLWQEPGQARPHRIVEPGRVDRRDFDELVAAWTSLTVALNSLSRSMGQPDAYPFALSEVVVEKLRFVHEVVSDAADPEAAAKAATPAETAPNESVSATPSPRTSLAAATLLVLGVACEHTVEGARQDAEQVETLVTEEAARAARSIEIDTVNFERKAGAALADLDAKLENLQRKASAAGAALKEDTARQIDALQEERNELAGRIDEARASTGDEWEAFKRSLDASMAKLGRDADRLLDELGDDVRESTK